MRRFTFGLVAAVMLTLPAGAAATTFNVNAFLDTQSDGVCDADCTVRDAVTAADGSDTILVPPGTHTVSLAGAPEDLNASGDIDANAGDDPLTIRGTGPGPSAVTIDATGLGDRVFDLSGEAQFLIANLTITGGSAADGAGIRNAGPELTLSEVVLDANTAPLTGGGILNGTTAITGSRVTILNSVLSDNGTLGGQGGGAIFNQEDGRVAIVGSTLSGNRAEGTLADGGAIRSGNEASLTIVTSRLEQNEAFGDGPGDGGGAIFTQNSSTATVAASVIANNQSGDGGGGIFANNDTSLTVIDSVLSGNSALSLDLEIGGGGIHAQNDSAVTILRSTLSGNSAAFGGGGVTRDDDGVLEIVNSTLSGNTTPGAGGAVHANSASFPGYTRIDHSTIAANTAGTAGGGIFNSTGAALFEPLVLAGTIVSGNLVAGAPQNCAAEIAGAGPLVSRGFNLDSGATCGFTATGDLQNANALLGPLADNGGPTLTHLPGAGGAAIDTGVSGGHDTDQRGGLRTVDQPATANAAGSDGTDIGAVELALQPTPPLPVAPLPVTPPTAARFDLKAAIAKCKKKFPKGKKRKKCIKRAKARA